MKTMPVGGRGKVANEKREIDLFLKEIG